MPGHAVHLEIARAMLDRQPTSHMPSWAGNAESRNAYLHGALNPDLGLFPFGDPSVTDLSHHARTAELVRNLVAFATDEPETAYAWGWVTHFVADTHLHPIINRACSEHAGKPPGATMIWSEAPGIHMRVELGLDVVRLVRNEELRDVRLRDFLRGPRISFVQRAFQETYGVTIHPRSLRRGHQVLGQGQKALFAIGDTLGRQHLGEPRRPRDLALTLLYGPARWVGGRLSVDSIPYAITHSLPPQGWLEEAVLAALDELPERFTELLSGALRDLPNLNLDNGEPLET